MNKAAEVWSAHPRVGEWIIVRRIDGGHERVLLKSIRTGDTGRKTYTLVFDDDSKWVGDIDDLAWHREKDR